MTEKDILLSINKRLEVIVNLLLERPIADNEKMVLRGQIKKLHSLGLQPKAIGEILGKTNTYVSKEITGLKKGKMKK